MPEIEFTTEELEREEWRDIPGFEGYYQASSLGRIRRIKAATNTFAGRIMRLKTENYRAKHQKPYPRKSVKLTVRGKCFHSLAHTLVAKAFLGECPKGKEVNHKDGNPCNNRAVNLEYVTHKENQQHASNNGLLSRKGERGGNVKLTTEQVLIIRASTETNKALAEHYNIGARQIGAIRRRAQWKHV